MFWMQYVDMMHLYREFTRSVRVGDIDAYIGCLPKLSNYFFALNHPNYARWTVQYHNNLLMLQDTHPETYEEFQRGLFSIRRTKKPFFGSPIDLTLEQTINNDAASQRSGISSITNSISARQRWAESHYLRMSVINDVLEEAGMKKKEDITYKLRPDVIRKDNECVSKLRGMIKENLNPFNMDDKEHLYNIATGKSVSKQTEDFLLHVLEIGNKERIKFINECIARPERFEQRIKRQNLHTFATEGGKKKLTSKDGKLEETCLIRDLFGSILYVSLEKKVDMAEVLTYPLTPVPLSLSHVDGTMLKTDKSKLYSVLEPNKKSDPPVANETVIDASFFLYLQLNLPSTFGGVARAILSKVMNHNGSVIHYVTDKWLSPSIKDSERVGRNSSDQTYEIKGPNQKRPTKWMDALKNPNFKIALNKYLIDAWNDDSLAHIFQGKTLYANCGDVCYKYSPGENTVLRREESRLFSTHEEADSRMFHHIASSTLLHQSNSDAESNMVVRTNDVDCLVIAIGCFENLLALNKNIKLWLEVGVESKNNLRYINVNEIYENLGPLLASALLAFHAFFGCDYLAAFSRKGKVRPYNLLKTDVPAQEAFASLSEGLPEVNEEVIDEIERFLCKVYGKKKVT